MGAGFLIVGGRMKGDRIEEISTRLLGRSSSGGSSESRWVDGSEVNWDEVPVWPKRDDGREGFGSVRRRLSKLPKRVDSFDVEAMEIAGTHAHHSKVDQSFLFALLPGIMILSMFLVLFKF